MLKSGIFLSVEGIALFLNNYHHANQTNVISDDEYGAEYGSLLSSPCTRTDSAIADGEAGPWPGGFACPGQGNLPQLAISGYGQQTRMLRHRKGWKDHRPSGEADQLYRSERFCCQQLSDHHLSEGTQDGCSG